MSFLERIAYENNKQINKQTNKQTNNLSEKHRFKCIKEYQAVFI